MIKLDNRNVYLDMTHQETNEFYYVNSQNSFISKNDTMEHHSRLGCSKRPAASTSSYVSCGQPSTVKRCRKNSLSSSDPDTFEMNTNSFDQDLSCSSNNSSSFSPTHHPQQHPKYYRQENQQQPAVDETTARNQQRLLRTTEMLKESGLYDVAVRTAALIRQNQQSRKELEELREETKRFLKDVLNNPENNKINQILSSLEKEKQNIPNSLILDSTPPNS